MITIKELFTTYWTQTTLVLTGLFAVVFYLIKRVYDLKGKKAEVKFSLFEQNKLSAIMDFISSYAVAEWHFHDKISNLCAADFNPSKEEIDEEISPPLKKCLASFAHLIFYLPKEELMLFEMIHDNIRLLNALFYKVCATSLEERRNDILNFLGQAMKFINGNKDLMGEIGRKTQGNYV